MATARTFGYFPTRPEARPRQRVATAPSRELVLYGDLAGVLRNVAVLMGSCLAGAQLLLLYRLYCQLAGVMPGAPGSWLYSLSGVVVAPFRRYETSPLGDGSRALEFALLVAIEGLLAFGLLVIMATYQGSKLASVQAPNPWVGRYEVGPAVALWQRSDRRAESATRWTLRQLGHGLQRIDATLTSGQGQDALTRDEAARRRFESELSRTQPRHSLR
jgi:hypothetical protein